MDYNLVLFFVEFAKRWYYCFREQTYLLGTDSSSDSAPASKRNSFHVSEDNIVADVEADKVADSLQKESPEKKDFPDEVSGLFCITLSP